MSDLTVEHGRVRISSVDLLRGIVIVIMALDHVRDYFSITAVWPTDLAQSDSAYFFARWITHFCAPVFVFLSGVSAFLYQNNRRASDRELSKFLLSRGLWLVFLEVTFISFFWQFGYQIMIAQVIWAIGWSMIFLGLLVFLPRPAVLAVGLVLIIGHNTLDGIDPALLDDWSWAWNVLHVQGFIPFPGIAAVQGMWVAYPLIPWIGVMAVGYAFGSVMYLPAERRDRAMYMIGAAAITAFLLLRGFNLYGDPGVGPADAPWTDHGRGRWFAFLSFLNTTKYPPSLLFLLMTLGPSVMLMPVLERWRGRAADFITIFGRVPFLFYVAHLPLIHLASIAWVRIAYGATGMSFIDPNSWPPAYTPSLLRAYLAWFAVVALLYWPCKRFVAYRKLHRRWWLSYL